MSEPEHLGGWIPLDEHSIVPELWKYLLRRFQPESMVDLGCGEAWAALWFLAHGVDAWGIDGSLEAEAAAVLPNYKYLVHDFTKGPCPLVELAGISDGFEFVYSVEFLEHVDEQHLPAVLDTFARARVAAVTYAWPGQPGHHHVNCQNEGYWVEKFASVGLEVDEDATRETRALPQVQQRQAYWGRTGLVLVRP